MFLVLAISNIIRLCEKQEFGYFVSGWISDVIGVFCAEGTLRFR